MDKPKMFYFGPWDAAGHHLRDERGFSMYREGRGSLPWKMDRLDGVLQPHREGCDRRSYCACGHMPEGLAMLHHEGGWTALSFWDRTVDTRGGCNSSYFAEGTFSFEEMVAMAKERFAERWNKMPFKVVPYKFNENPGGLKPA